MAQRIGEPKNLINAKDEIRSIKNYRYIANNVQQGLEIRGFWFQKKTVQLKTVLLEVYTYVLNDIFFQKSVYLRGFLFKIRVS